MGFVWVPLWGYHMPHGWFFWGVGGVLIAVFWILLFVILLSFLFTKRPWRPYHYFDEDPLEILKRRYARGEITKEEYERMREDLRR